MTRKPRNVPAHARARQAYNRAQRALAAWPNVPVATLHLLAVDLRELDSYLRIQYELEQSQQAVIRCLTCEAEAAEQERMRNSEEDHG